MATSTKGGKTKHKRKNLQARTMKAKKIMIRLKN